MRHLVVLLVLAASLLVGVSDAFAAKAPSGSPFTNYRQAAAAQYNPQQNVFGQYVTHCRVVVENGQRVQICQACRTNIINGVHQQQCLPPTREVLGSTINNNGQGNQGNGTSGGVLRTVTGARGLPFTGLNLLLLVLIGLALVSAGVLIAAGERIRRPRRLARPTR